MKKCFSKNEIKPTGPNCRFISAIFIILCLCFSNLLFGQTTLDVNGVVSDQQGDPIIGAAVGVKGQSKGTFTDIDGRYSITNVSSDAILTFSFIGYQTLEVNVAGRKNIDVKLEEESKVLDEVIVIGYGVAKKKDLTGAIASLDGAKISARQNTQVTTALQGALPGVTVTRSSSAPGTAGSIRVRGITSMRDEAPLVIIDGVPANSLNDVNASDIENLTVLKDASSASIYGARAAAGVILVTTKRGAKQGVSINYDYSYSMDYASDMPDYADAVTYMKVLNEREWNDSGAVPGTNEYSIYDKDYIDNYWSLNKQNPDLYPNTDWTDLILKSYAPRQSHQLSVMAGGEKYKTNVSLGYDDVEGLFKENLSWTRVSARINNDIKITKWLSTSIDLNLRKTSAINPAYSPSNQMRYAAPVYAGVYSDGRLAPGKDGTNPYGKMMYGGTTSERRYQANAKLGITITPLDGLSVSGVLAPIFNFTKGKTFTKQVLYYPEWDDTKTTKILDGTNNMDLTEIRNDSHSYTTQLFGNYAKEFNEHNINVMLGYEEFYYFYESLTSSSGQYALPYYPYLDAGPKNLLDSSGDAIENSYRSYFGRLMYNWKSKYFLQANLRRDGSSRFHADYRWGTFPSFSAGWMMSEEGFMKNIAFISSLKFRGSWGQLGDERIGNYTYQSYITFNNPTLYIGSTPSSLQGASAYQYVIKDKTWETTTTTDIGLDLSVLNGRLRLSGDYYWKDTKDMLLLVNIPIFMGYSDPYQNIGKMKTKGWDFEIGWNDKIGDLTYGVNFNIYDYKSTMGYLKNTLQDNKSAWTLIREGDEYLSYYGYLSDGIYQTGDELGAVTSAVVGAGDIRYKDISGPDGVPDGIISSEYDRVVLGSSLPRFNYGGSVNIAYKGIDLDLTFQGVGKKKAIMTEQMAQPIRADWYNVPEIIVGKYWSNYNTEEQNRAAIYPRVMRNANANNYVASDFWLFDGSYFRVKNITLGYTLPRRIVEKVQLKNVRIYTSLQDIFTISDYPKGWDPEVSSTGYPITKSVMFGMSIKM